MKFRHIFIFFVIVSGTVSYFYSKKICNFYNRIYYLDYKKESPGLSTEKAWKMYKQKKYPELRKYLKKIRTLYPENKELKKILALTLIAEGEKEMGAAMLFDIIDDSGNNMALFTKAIRIIFKKKHYTDIIEKLSKLNIDGNEELLFIYGVSLYRTKRYNEALKYLQLSEKMGNDRFEIYHYIALVYEDLGKYKSSIKFLSKAIDLHPMNKELVHTLIRLYRKTGQIHKAERLLRKKF